MTAFSDQLLADHIDVWNAMQQHPFVQAIEQGTLPETAFHRYLVFEGEFVFSAVEILAQGLSHAPDVSRQRWLIQGLNGLVDTQLGWFERVMAKRGVVAEHWQPAPAGFIRFRDGMLQAARTGGYADIMVLMFGAEWMYYHWCARAAARPQHDEDLRDWLSMHADDAFYQQACWLKQEVDQCGLTLSGQEKQRLSQLYGDVLAWEIDFHQAMLG
ncbi:TenA family transcriptional regulator [Mangrovibacter sp. MFB070]|uniref:TenA family protein n=1 Tax=Mangrovibacter sp. MFB070 TaxID=1224318 RepID=UPI0004DA7BDD|nr:TenA family protein [Mangrovibacter sp. MFB070]KEA53324.1 TenA family transcriptional regulator [Mangrovibacter sp. MFB070]